MSWEQAQPCVPWSEFFLLSITHPLWSWLLILRVLGMAERNWHDFMGEDVFGRKNNGGRRRQILWEVFWGIEVTFALLFFSFSFFMGGGVGNCQATLITIHLEYDSWQGVSEFIMVPPRLAPQSFPHPPRAWGIYFRLHSYVHLFLNLFGPWDSLLLPPPITLGLCSFSCHSLYPSISVTLYLFTPSDVFQTWGQVTHLGLLKVILESDRNIYRPRVGVVLGNATQSSAWKVVYALGTLTENSPIYPWFKLNCRCPWTQG